MIADRYTTDEGLEMNRHTPGPWEINGAVIETVKKPWVVIGRAYDEQDSSGGISDWVEAKANACLMAAAPDLLAAAEDALEALLFLEQRMSARVNPPTLQNLQAAISKAKG